MKKLILISALMFSSAANAGLHEDLVKGFKTGKSFTIYTNKDVRKAHISRAIREALKGSRPKTRIEGDKITVVNKFKKTVKWTRITVKPFIKIKDRKHHK